MCMYRNNYLKSNLPFHDRAQIWRHIIAFNTTHRKTACSIDVLRKTLMILLTNLSPAHILRFEGNLSYYKTWNFDILCQTWRKKNCSCWTPKLVFLGHQKSHDPPSCCATVHISKYVYHMKNWNHLFSRYNDRPLWN